MYISVADAAEKWGVSPRQVQRLLADNRIPYAKKYGRSWQIPENTPKPGDPRRFKRMPEAYLASELTHIIAAAYLRVPRDAPDSVVDAVKTQPLQLILEGALAYARGDFERTLACYRQHDGNDAARLYTSRMAVTAAISLGDYSLYSEIEAFLKGIVQTNVSPDVSAFAQLALASGYLSAMSPGMVPDWLKRGDFSALDMQVRSDAAYWRAKYFQCIGDYKSMLAVAQTALCFCRPKHELSFPTTYLTLLCAIACFALDDAGEAERYLLEAMRLNLPGGFITPFAELVPLLGGIVERLLERHYPEYTGAVIKQWDRTYANWLTFHNRFANDNITLILSLREYELARLVARRIPYAKIAKQHCISVSRLKGIMTVVYDKLFINSRDELAKFIL